MKKPDVTIDLNTPEGRAAFQEFKRNGQIHTPTVVEQPKAKEKKPKGMNKTEARWRDILECQQRNGEIREFAYEPFPIRLADSCKYWPDFVSILPGTSSIRIKDLTELFTLPAACAVRREDLFDLVELLRIIDKPVIRIDELKGAHIWEDSKIKARMVRELYPWIQFRMWQWKKGEWNQLL